jgi:hypothetical protein
LKKIKNPILEWQKLEKQIENKDQLSTKEYVDVLERSIEVLLYLRKQDLSVRDFMMDKSMELINKMEKVKKINSNLSLDDYGFSALPQEELPGPTIHEYLGMSFNKPEKQDWKNNLKKKINKGYRGSE